MGSSRGQLAFVVTPKMALLKNCSERSWKCNLEKGGERGGEGGRGEGKEV